MANKGYLKNKYLRAEKFFYIHKDDYDLKPIQIPLPDPPPYEEIEGYGLKPEEQFFTYEEYPYTLKKLEKDLAKDKEINLKARETPYLTIGDIWSYLKLNAHKYQKEIEWIKTQWYYRLHGKWYYIKGRPYWLCGWHWFFLNYYDMPEGGRFEYRDRDRRQFNAIHHFYHTKEDHNGNKFPYYTCHGINICDGRRFGKTSKVANIHLELLTRTANFNGGIQGMDENNARKVFKEHMIYQFSKLPFFFKPATTGSTNPERRLILRPASIAQGSQGSVIDTRRSLESYLDFATTADRSFYDKARLNFYHGDEPGKTKTDVYNGHFTVRQCIAPGAGRDRIGFIINSTTVEEVGVDGANVEFFEKLIKGSDHHDRNEKNGMTPTGLVNIYLPSDDGLQGFIDEWGFSKKEGALEWILTQRDEHLKKGELGIVSALTRKFPIKFREIFTPSADQIVFNRQVLDARISGLKMANYGEHTFNCNLRRSDISNLDSPVILEKREDGKFTFSFEPNMFGYSSNEHYTKDGIWYPAYPKRGIIGADAFMYNEITGRKGSDGGIAAYWSRDKTIDPNDNIESWSSDRIIVTYQHRPQPEGGFTSTEVYAEDVLMLAEYLGFMVYPERNVSIVIDHFRARKRHGYLMHEYRVVGGKPVASEQPGYSIKRKEMKQEMFGEIGAYIDRHGMRCKHLDFLIDCSKIRSIQELNKYDRFAAVGGCMLGRKSLYPDLLYSIDDEEPEFSMCDIMR